VDSIFKLFDENCRKLGTNGLRTKLEMYRLVFQRIPQHLSEMLFPPELRDLVCLLLAKKKASKRRKEKEKTVMLISMPLA